MASFVSRIWSNAYSRYIPPHYEKVSSAEELLVSDKDGFRDTLAEHGNLQSKGRGLFLILAHIFLLVANVLVLLVTLTTRSCSVVEALSITAGYSPIFQDLGSRVNVKDVSRNGTVFPPREQAFSRKQPGDTEAEAMWEFFETTDFFPLTKNDIIRMGKDPETAAKFPDEHFGFGDEAYIGGLDMPHKIHCLNEIRKMAFGRYPGHTKDTFVQFSNDSNAEWNYHEAKHGKIWWYHLRHCVDMLAQEIICHADGEVLTYNFRDSQVWPFPDFSINRKCRDIDQLLAWNRDHRVDTDKFSEVVRNTPEALAKSGTKLLPFEKEWYEIMGFEGSTMFPDGQGFEAFDFSSFQ